MNQSDYSIIPFKRGWKEFKTQCSLFQNIKVGSLECQSCDNCVGVFEEFDKGEVLCIQ